MPKLKYKIDYYNSPAGKKNLATIKRIAEERFSRVRDPPRAAIESAVCFGTIEGYKHGKKLKECMKVSVLEKGKLIRQLFLLPFQIVSLQDEKTISARTGSSYGLFLRSDEIDSDLFIMSNWYKSRNVQFKGYELDLRIDQHASADIRALERFFQLLAQNSGYTTNIPSVVFNEIIALAGEYNEKGYHTRINRVLLATGKTLESVL